MRKLIYVLFLLLPVLGFSQSTSVSLGTSSTGKLSVSHNTWTKVDPNVTLTANGTITGFRVQISQSYISGTNGDQLRSTATLPSGISVSTFNNTTGVLVFNGTTTASNWETILRGVEFRSTTSTCYALQRRITFVAGTVFYNPLTEHFYEYVSGSITFTNSVTAAQTKSYFGRAGYLATMSSEAENNFVWRLMASDCWFGASDEVSLVNAAKGTTAFTNQSAVEGKWHWISGPEKGTNFSNGNWGSGPTTVSGQYAKWAGGEPNNSGGEHYGQFYSANSGQWNDLPNTNLNGYLCEYGDMPGDITTSTTILTRNIEINGASSGFISGGNINVCSGSNSTTLTLNSYTGSVVRWESSFDNFFTAGTTISSTSSSITVTNLTKTTYYRAIVNSSSPVSCSGLATSSVYVTVKPTKSGTVFAANNSICAGGQVELTLSGQQGNVNKWQRSTDNVNWTNISNTTTSLTETISSAGTYYYRVEVQTPSCGSAVNSSSKTITVTSGTPPVGGGVSSSTHTSTTNSGTLTLSSYSGTIVKWQRSTNDGVNWIDITNTASTYSYTNITSKTLFRAQLQSGTCGFAYSSNGTVSIITETISGTITIPSGLSTRPQVKLYLVVGTTETLLQTVTVGVTGTFTLNPTTYNSTYKVVPTYTGVVNNTDFNLVFNESQNENVPTLLSPGLVLTSGQRMKSGDINKDGKITISDAYLLGANLTGLVPYNEVFWYTASNFNSMTISNFNSFTPVEFFVINFTTSSVILNIKYIVKGDVDLSSSSN
jgi:hypothetical protein